MKPLSEVECQRFLDHVSAVRSKRLGAVIAKQRIRPSESRGRELNFARKVRRVMHANPMTADWLARKMLADAQLVHCE